MAARRFWSWGDMLASAATGRLDCGGGSSDPPKAPHRTDTAPRKAGIEEIAGRGIWFRSPDLPGPKRSTVQEVADRGIWFRIEDPIRPRTDPRFELRGVAPLAAPATARGTIYERARR